MLRTSLHLNSIYFGIMHHLVKFPGPNSMVENFITMSLYGEKYLKKNRHKTKNLLWRITSSLLWVGWAVWMQNPEIMSSFDLCSLWVAAGSRRPWSNSRNISKKPAQLLRTHPPSPAKRERSSESWNHGENNQKVEVQKNSPRRLQYDMYTSALLLKKNSVFTYLPLRALGL